MHSDVHFFWADVHEKGEKREHVLREEWLVFIRLLMSWCLTMGRGRGSFFIGSTSSIMLFF